jgi:thiol-disulfide isomerase/thioredoxin
MVKAMRGNGKTAVEGDCYVDGVRFENYFARIVAHSNKSMRKISVRLWSLAAVLFFAHSTFAAKLGDAAAPLKVASWAKGTPVDLATLKGKAVVVVEFWATWCPPCIKSIPHLTELQKKYQDVVFVGVSAEDAATVKKFAAKQGALMDYHVAVDADGGTSEGYMVAFARQYIPRAFIVDKVGRVVWHGSPLQGLDAALNEVLAGKVDLAKNEKRIAAQDQLQEFLQLLNEGKNSVALKKMGQELDALERELGGITPGEKFSAADYFKQLDFQNAANDFQRAVSRDASPEQLAPLEQKMRELAPADFKVDALKENLKLRKVLSAYYLAASGETSTNNLPALTQAVAALKGGDNAEVLGQFAWALLTQPEIKVRDLSLIMQLAKTAVAADGEKSPMLLDVYAHALFDAGQTAEAIAQQKKALAVATDDTMREEIAGTLKKYEAKAVVK